MSTATRRGPRPHGFADPHELLPGRFSHVFEILSLGAILAGDAVAFQQIAAVAMPTSSPIVVWTFVGALSAAATISMHAAGISSRRRQAGAHEAGWLWFCCLIAGWAALGGMALWFRLAEAAASQAPAASDSVFATAVPTGFATQIPLAALMLGLYLVGGITAYGIGYAMHNPARATYRRAKGEQRRAGRAHRYAMWRRQRANAQTATPASGMVAQRILRAVAPGPRSRTAPPSRLDVAIRPARDVDAIADELAERREIVLNRARAQADQLREVARHRLATALAEPARTSGVFDGYAQPTDQPQPDLTQGSQS